MRKKLYRTTYTFDGKRYQVYSSKSKADATKKAILEKNEREKSSVVINDKTTVEKYSEIWLHTYKESIVQKSTYNSYKNYIVNYVVPEIGGLKINQVKKTNLQSILNKQIGKSKNHCHKLRLTMQQLFKQAVEDGLIIRSPASSLDLPNGKSAGTHRSITEEERQAILKVSKNHRGGLWILFMLYCGLRPQEAATIKYSDIDRINHRLTISRALGADGAIKMPKTDAGIRTVPVPPILYDLIDFPQNIDQWIFKTRDGEHYSRTVMRNIWRSFIRNVDIEMGADFEMVNGQKKIIKSVIADDLVPYCLRHTYCTDLEAAGVPLNVASKLMGHTNIQLTAKIYSHMRTDIMDEAAEKITAYTDMKSSNTSSNTLLRETKPNCENIDTKNNKYKKA